MNHPRVDAGKRDFAIGEEWPLKSDLCSPATHVGAHIQTQMLQPHPWASLRVRSPRSLGSVWRHLLIIARGGKQ